MRWRGGRDEGRRDEGGDATVGVQALQALRRRANNSKGRASVKRGAKIPNFIFDRGIGHENVRLKR